MTPKTFNTPLLLLLLSCRNDTPTDIKTETLDTAADAIDADGDGYYAYEDCDDSDATNYPGATEICDGLDNNCDGQIDENILTLFYLDNDGDGFGNFNESVEACQAPEDYVPNGNDCDDDDEVSYPSASERCDGVDNDCDGEIDEDVLLEWFLDEDGDGFGSDYMIEACNPTGDYVEITGDCDDDNPDAYPENEEVCDEIDNNCDGEIDEDLTFLAYVDADEDGFGDDFTVVAVCELELGMTLTPGDCDDINNAINPNADEVCDDGLDNNCDGYTDETTSIDASMWFLDTDGDGSGDPANSTYSCDQPTGYVAIDDDCDDSDGTIYPNAPEICDGLINTCGGTLPTDETDDDGDGYVECSIDVGGWDGVSISGGDDCDDGDALIFPAQQWYADLDGDGFGNPSVSFTSCVQPANTVLDNTDCNDSNANEFPGQVWYTDTDGDGFGNGSSTTTSCTQPANTSLDNTDCDDGNANNFPGQVWYMDMDGDGFGDPSNSSSACTPPTSGILNNTDCNDSDSTIYPSAPELCDGLVNTCGGTLPAIETDNDGDGYVECSIDSGGWDSSPSRLGDDCDDGDSAESPAVTWYADVDGDGFGNAGSSSTCSRNAPSDVLNNTDCDDGDSSENPNVTWYTDVDGDTFGNPSSAHVCTRFAPSDVLNNTDCDDGDSTVFPNASELCDGQINNCNTSALPGNETDNDGDGYVECSIDSGGWDVSPPRSGGDCNDGNASTHPNATESIGDGVDSDCNGGEICILDADNDGHGNPSGLTQVSSDADCSDAFEALASNTDDCDDNNANLNPTVGCILGSCAEVLSSGQGTTSGVYTVDPDGQGGNAPFDVYCDMSTDGGGWMRVTHLHSNRSIGSIKRDVPFFSAAWQQNSSTFSNRTNSTLVLDNNTYGMLDVDDIWTHTSDVRLTCNDNTRGLSARALWTPSSSQLNSWLAEGNDVNEYQNSPTTVSLSKNGSSFSNANVYLAHNESAFFGSWHVCGRLSATTGGFQLGFCNNGPGTGDSGASNANQIMLGYHAGFSGLRLECTRDTPNPTSIINGNLSIWVR